LRLPRPRQEDLAACPGGLALNVFDCRHRSRLVKRFPHSAALCEQEGVHHPADDEEIHLLGEVAQHVDRFAAANGGTAGLHLLGTSGTVTTIAGVFLKLKRYDRRRVDGCWLSDHEISRVVGELMAMSFDERAANPCIGAERADLVLAGCAILDAIRRKFPCTRLRVADRGLREGMLVEMMRADGVWGEA